jgi:hypothetical protein
MEKRGENKSGRVIIGRTALSWRPPEALLGREEEKTWRRREDEVVLKGKRRGRGGEERRREGNEKGGRHGRLGLRALDVRCQYPTTRWAHRIFWATT